MLDIPLVTSTDWTGKVGPAEKSGSAIIIFYRSAFAVTPIFQQFLETLARQILPSAGAYWIFRFFLDHQQGFATSLLKRIKVGQVKIQDAGILWSGNKSVYVVGDQAFVSRTVLDQSLRALCINREVKLPDDIPLKRPDAIPSLPTADALGDPIENTPPNPTPSWKGPATVPSESYRTAFSSDQSTPQSKPQIGARKIWGGLGAAVVILGVCLAISKSCSESNYVAEAKRAVYCIGILSWAQSAAYNGQAGAYHQRELLDAASQAGRKLRGRPQTLEEMEAALRNINAGRKFVPSGLTIDDVTEIDQRVERWAAASGDRGGKGWNGHNITGSALAEVDSCYNQYR